MIHISDKLQIINFYDLDIYNLLEINNYNRNNIYEYLDKEKKEN